MKELKREVIIKGKPNISNMSKNELKIFYRVLLNQILEYHKEKIEIENCINAINL